MKLNSTWLIRAVFLGTAILAGACTAVSAQTPDELLRNAFSQINTGVKKNSDTTVTAGLDLLRKFAQQAPDNHRLKNEVTTTLAFLDKMRATEQQLALHPETTRIENPDKTIVTSGVISGRVLELPRPTSTPLAKAAKAHGSVSVRIEVGEDGKVARILLVTGHPLLQQPAVEAALKARFAPTKLHGVVIRIQGNLVYNFE